MNYGYVTNGLAVEMATKICDCIGHGKYETAVHMIIETAVTETGLGRLEDKTDAAGMGITQFDKIPFADVRDRCIKLKPQIEKDLGVDITKVDLNTISQSDLVIYSPPCQSWSIAGKQKGLNDIRGTLFWNALDIIKKSNPKYAIMENVNNLPNKFTDEFNEMLKCLDDAGYNNY